MNYSYAMEKRDIARIDKLNKIVDLANYWDVVRGFTSSIKTDHAIKRWQILAEVRHKELEELYIKRYQDKLKLIKSITTEDEMTQVANFVFKHGSLTGLSENIKSNASTLKMYYSQLKIYNLI